MTSTYTTPSHVEIDIRRPNGEIETVNLTAKAAHMTEISDRMFAQIQRDTKAAGRGEVLAYRNVRITKELTYTAEEIALAKSEREYRESYNRIVNASAAGERDESRDRPSREPWHKGD